MFNVNFEEDGLQLICHARLKGEGEKAMKVLSSQLQEHILIFSSGTTSSDLKGLALSKKALLANACAVNEHLDLNSKDVWGLSLPHYHVGGLAVMVRAHLLDSEVVDCGIWDPMAWARCVREKKVTVTSLVPTQIYDLVHNQIKAPSDLKFLIVGGDHLSLELEKRAQSLGWPLMKTYGMTEVCSQLASSRTPASKELEILPIHQVRVDNDERLWVKSESLFTLEFKIKQDVELTWAKEQCDSEGYFPTQDRVQLHGNQLVPLGRLDDQVKINGKLLGMNQLREHFQKLALEKEVFGKLELILEKDERSGKKIVVLHLPESMTSALAIEFIEVLSPHRVEFREVGVFSRTDLGKLKMS